MTSPSESTELDSEDILLILEQDCAENQHHDVPADHDHSGAVKEILTLLAQEYSRGAITELRELGMGRWRVTNPTEQFREAVESALLPLMAEIGWTVNEHGQYDQKEYAEALASIQASVVELFTRLVGEDDVPKPEPEDNIAPAGWCGTCDQIFNDEGDCLCVWRNELRQELRQKIDQLIKDLTNE